MTLNFPHSYVIFRSTILLTVGLLMSFNLALLTAAEKNRVELDKQASYLVWRLKQAKAGPEEITKQMAKIASESEKQWFQQSIEKYKRVMGVA
ncbi:DUF3283 domain-containing protein [Vibrio cholerae]